MKAVARELVRRDVVPEVLIRDGADLALSPDGMYLAYMHLRDGGPVALWRVNVDGTGARHS